MERNAVLLLFGVRCLNQCIRFLVRLRSEGMIMALEKELETYQRELPSLLSHEGKYVLIHDTQVAGFWDTYEDALQAGYTRFKLTPFLVKRVQGVEAVQYFTRDITACQS
jgi:hypothetical protein